MVRELTATNYQLPVFIKGVIMKWTVIFKLNNEAQTNLNPGEKMRALSFSDSNDFNIAWKSIHIKLLSKFGFKEDEDLKLLSLIRGSHEVLFADNLSSKNLDSPYIDR